MGALQRTAKVDSWIERLPAGLQAEWDKTIIYRAAIHMHDRGMAVGMAIASAINWCKHIVATDDVKQWPGTQHVRPSSVAECAHALAVWEAMKAAAHASRKTAHSSEDSVTTTLALAGAFNTALHPHQAAGGPTGGQFAPARNSQAAAAQKDKGAQANYGKTLGAKDAKGQVGAMSNDDLIALSKAAYSFKSSDPKVVALRNTIASEIAKRGGNVNDYGGLGKGTPGGPKPLKGGPAKPAAPKPAAKKAAVKKPAAPKAAKAVAKKNPAKPGATATPAQQAAATQAAKANHATLNSSHPTGRVTVGTLTCNDVKVGTLSLATGANSSSDGPRVTINANMRRAMAKSGVALADGSFPIASRDDVRKAVMSIGRAPEAKRPMIRAHIRRRARALGVPVPDGATTS